VFLTEFKQARYLTQDKDSVQNDVYLVLWTIKLLLAKVKDRSRRWKSDCGLLPLDEFLEHNLSVPCRAEDLLRCPIFQVAFRLKHSLCLWVSLLIVIVLPCLYFMFAYL
jgi:hypothetical protein